MCLNHQSPVDRTIDLVFSTSILIRILKCFHCPSISPTRGQGEERLRKNRDMDLLRSSFGGKYNLHCQDTRNPVQNSKHQSVAVAPFQRTRKAPPIDMSLRKCQEATTIPGEVLWCNFLYEVTTNEVKTN